MQADDRRGQKRGAASTDDYANELAARKRTAQALLEEFLWMVRRWIGKLERRNKYERSVDEEKLVPMIVELQVELDRVAGQLARLEQHQQDVSAPVNTELALLPLLRQLETTAERMHRGVQELDLGELNTLVLALLDMLAAHRELEQLAELFGDQRSLMSTLRERQLLPTIARYAQRSPLYLLRQVTDSRASEISIALVPPENKFVLCSYDPRQNRVEWRLINGQMSDIAAREQRAGYPQHSLYASDRFLYVQQRTAAGAVSVRRIPLADQQTQLDFSRQRLLFSATRTGPMCEWRGVDAESGDPLRSLLWWSQLDGNLVAWHEDGSFDNIRLAELIGRPCAHGMRVDPDDADVVWLLDSQPAPSGGFMLVHYAVSIPERRLLGARYTQLPYVQALGERPVGPAQIAGDTLYVLVRVRRDDGEDRMELLAVRHTTGELRWRFPLFPDAPPADVGLSLQLDSQRRIWIAAGRYLRCYALTGASADLPASPPAPPTPEPDDLDEVPDDEAYQPDLDGGGGWVETPTWGDLREYRRERDRRAAAAAAQSSASPPSSPYAFNLAYTDDE